MSDPWGSLPIAVAGDPTAAALVAREILARRLGRPVIICGSAGEAAAAADDLAGELVVGKDLAAVRGCRLVVLAGEAARLGEPLVAAAACVARYAPEAVVVIGGPGSNASAQAFLRSAHVGPGLVIGAGGLAGQRSRASALARAAGVDRSQVSLLVVGDEEPLLAELPRYSAVAGIPAVHAGAGARSGPVAPPGAAAHAAAIGAVAEAVLRDRRRVLCCGALIEAGHGLPTCFATFPLVVGARGVERIFPISLTLDERAFLQRAAAAIEHQVLGPSAR